MRDTTRSLSAICLTVLLTASVFALVGVAPAASQAANEPLPPGVTTDGVNNSTALVDGHRAAVNETGATLATGAEFELNDSLRASQSTTSTFGEGVTPLRLRTIGTFTDENETIEFTSDQWANETLLVSRVSYENETEFYKQYLNNTEGTDDFFSGDLPRRFVEDEATGASLIEGTLALGNFTVESTESVNGENLTTLTATSVDESEFDGTVTVEQFDATLVVNEDGRVRSLNTTVSYTAATNATGVGNATDPQNASQRANATQGANASERANASANADATSESSFTYSYDLELLATGDSDALEPLWSDRGVEQVAASVDMTDNETYFTLTNDGPDALPPNSTVEAIRENQSVNLTLADGLGVGESLYVYYPSDGGPPQLVDTPPSAENATTLSGSYDFVIRTPDGQELVFIGFGFESENATETNALTDPSITVVGDGVAE